MGKVYKIVSIKDMRDDVAETLKNRGGQVSIQEMADALGISYGYLENMKTTCDAPSENLELSIRAAKTYNDKCYKAIIVPTKFLPNIYWRPEDLPVFELEETPTFKDPPFDFSCFDADNLLYKNVITYWRMYRRNIRRDTPAYLSSRTGLCARTIQHAIRGNINPRLSTVQKILRVYNRALVLIKFDKPSSIKTIKIVV